MNIFYLLSSVILYSITLNQTTCQNVVDNNLDYLWTLTEILNFNHPFIVDAKKYDLVIKIKQFNQITKFLTLMNSRINNQTILQCDTVIFLNKDSNSELSLGLAMRNKKKTLIILQDHHKFEEISQSLEIKLNKEVYMYEISSRNLFETYEVNNIKIKQHLGTIPLDGSNVFLWQENVNHM